MENTGHRVAIVQQPPVMCDRQATLERAASEVDEAAKNGARLVVFPESYVPGYPEWIWRAAPRDYDVNGPLFALLLANSVDLESDDLAVLRDAARRNGVTVVCGLNERDGSFSRSTIYNTLVTIGPDGGILNRHRKLVPTNPERMVWGMGDGSGLRVVETPAGRVGGLICWENYMPLARYALYAQGVELYIASTWDEGDSWLATVRHIASEGRCWVLGSSNCLQANDLPQSLPGRAALYQNEDEWLNKGGSVVVDPVGRVVAGSMVETRGILYADCDPASARSARRTLDVAGHYGRPDVFTLHVNRERMVPAAFD